MAENKYMKLSLEELQKKHQSMKFMTGLLCGIIFVMFLTQVYTYWTTEEFSFMMFLPVVFLGGIVNSFVQLKKVKEALDSKTQD